LRDRIIDLSLEPGCNIDEKRLLGELDLGRTPLREALNRLIAEGLIEARGGRGLRVTPLNLTNTRELFEAYIISERVVASIVAFGDGGLAADLKRIEETYEARARDVDFLGVTATNADFHNRLARATRNEFVARHSSQLASLARRVSFYIFRNEYGLSDKIGATPAALFGRAIEEHRKIICAVEDRNRAGLVSLMTSHGEYFRERLLRLIGRSVAPEIGIPPEDGK